MDKKREFSMKEKLRNSMELENGMRLNIYDCSKRMAGDRWLVSLIVRMEIPVMKVLTHDGHQLPEVVNEVVNLLGESVLFEQKRERIFVDEGQKEAILQELLDMFLSSTIGYLSDEKFPRQYVLKKYREEIKKGSWYR